MVAIRIEDYLVKQGEPLDGKARKQLEHYVKAKLNGEPCLVCGQPIWSVGSAAIETAMCFTCITGEADHSDDYEIFEVCWI